MNDNHCPSYRLDSHRPHINAQQADIVKLQQRIAELEAEVVLLKSHTWQQERAAVAYWIRKLVRFPGAYPGAYAKRVERGEHWPK